MKVKHYVNKIFSAMVLTSILLQPVSTVYAYEVGKSVNDQVKINAESNAKGGKVSMTTNDHNVDILTEVNLVERVWNILDAAKFVNKANTGSELQDYKPDLKDTLMDLLPEYKYADIVEYEGFTSNNREPVTVDANADSSYASKLEWLISQNMINRTTYFMYNGDTVLTSSARTPRPKVDATGNTNTDEEAEGASSKQVNKHKFYNPEYKISKTDFLVELMKADKVLESRPIIVQQRYKRMDVNMNEAIIHDEPIETSPYASELGKTGLDYAENEVTVEHDVFKQAEILVTNDVTELYLEAALNKNIIKDDEFGGDEGKSFISSRGIATSVHKDGYMKRYAPIRQFYDSTSFKLHEKIISEYVEYPSEWVKKEDKDTVKDIINVTDSSEAGVLPPWGYSYHYNTGDEYCVFANTCNKLPIEIVKRPSIVEVNNKQYKYTPEIEAIKPEKGYEYFSKEEITEAEAYILTYKLLLAMGNESKLTDTEVEYLNSKYALNFSTFTEEERKATEYLIAKGIVDGGNENIYMASSTALTNETAIDLIYRVANKDARINFTPMMTSIDKEMATKGYSQANLVKTTQTERTFDVMEDITKGKKVYTVDEGGNLSETTKEPSKTYQEMQNKDRVANPSTYDLVYVRLPKSITDEVIAKDGYIKMLTNDDYRVTVNPYNEFLNYGKADAPNPADNILADEAIFNSPAVNNISYVFKDEDGYYWQRYILHKSMSSKVILQTYTMSGSRTLEGIRGEGIYYLDEDSKSNSLRKISLSDYANSRLAKRFGESIVSSDTSLRNGTYIKDTNSSNDASQDSKNDTNDTLKTVNAGGPGLDSLGSNSLVYLWTQKPYGDGTQPTTVSIQLGKDDVLGDILLNDSTLLVKKGNSWDINPDVKVSETIKNSLKELAIDKDTGIYCLQYESPYQNLKTAETDIGLKLGMIGSKSSNDKDGDVISAGYAKIDSNGKTVALIEKHEMEEKYNIQVMGSTGRMLYNKSTGQRAFINSEDHTTLIGNNVTHYGDNDLMVFATGDNTEKKTYYNLAIIVELINNTKAVMTNAGKDIYLGIGDPDATSAEEYRMIDIVDVHKGTSTDKEEVDTTYVASNNKFKDVYMNMSSVVGAGSNYVYYKNKDKNLKALVVYKPNLIFSDNIAQYDESKGAFKSTGSLTQVVKNKKAMDSSANQEGGNNLAKTLILKELFGLTESDAANDILQGNYIIDIYIMRPDSDIDGLTKDFNALVSEITHEDSTHLETLKRYTSYVNSVINSDAEFAKGDSKSDKTTIRFDCLYYGTNFMSDKDIVAHGSSGNLYCLINRNGEPYPLSSNSTTTLGSSIEALTGTKFYLKTSTDSNGEKYLYNVDKYETLHEKTKTNDAKDTIHMRYQKYYENTPDNYIPLEVYGTVNGRSSLGQAKSYSGAKSSNFGESVKVKLTAAPNEITAQDSNVYMTLVNENKTDKNNNSIDELALATLIELPYRAMDKAKLNKLLDSDTIYDRDRFYNTMYDTLIEDFSKELGDYNIKLAMEGSETGWKYNVKGTGLDKSTDTRVTKQKEQFFQGMWYGLLSNDTSGYYRLTSKELGKTEGKADYILVPGNASNEDAATQNATFYLMKVSAYGDVVSTTPIREYKDLPPIIRYYLEKGNGSYKKDAASKPEEVASDFGLDYTKEEDVKYVKEHFNDTVRIYYKPSLPIPAGTTLVKLPKKTNQAPTELILYPNADVRGYFYPAKDVINNILMMAQEKDDATFLYQLPKGSKIRFDNDVSMVKLSEALDVTNDGKLKWVQCASTPDATSNGIKIQNVSSNYITEAKLLSDFILRYYVTPISMKNSVTGGKVNLGEIVGPGAYRLPVLSELKFILGKSRDNTTAYTAVYDTYRNINSAYGFNMDQYDTTSGRCDYNPLIYSYDAKNDKMQVNSEAKEAPLILTMNMPPSIQVEEIEGLQNTWQVVSYWDVEGFNASAQDVIVSYIRQRDTNINSMTEILDTIKSSSIDGNQYKNAARDIMMKSKWNIFVDFVIYGIPAIAIILWVWMAVAFVVVYYGWTHEKARALNERFGFDIIERATFGVYTTNGPQPSLVNFIASSLLLFLALSIFWGKFLLVWVVNLIW